MPCSAPDQKKYDAGWRVADNPNSSNCQCSLLGTAINGYYETFDVRKEACFPCAVLEWTMMQEGAGSKYGVALAHSRDCERANQPNLLEILLRQLHR